MFAGRSVLIGTKLLGVATGLRSCSGVAGLVVTGTDGLPSGFRTPLARLVVVGLAATELVIDKLPSTPARTEVPGLTARVLFGGVSGWIAGRSTGPSPVPALIGSAAALVAAFTGVRARHVLSERIGPLPAAFAEDAVTGSLVAVGVYLLRRD
jgi:uncharacterized membrane protein